MARKPTYKELEQRVKELEKEAGERKPADEALRESEEKFKYITTSAKDAVIMMDDEGNIFFWNKAAEEIFGYSTQEALGKELHTFLAPQQYHDAYRKGVRTFKTTGQGLAVGKMLEWEAVKKDGTIFPIELSVSSVKLRGKWHAIGILRDITERKRVENELQRAHHELELRVGEHTTELVIANKQLKQEVEERKRAEEELRKTIERMEIANEQSVIYARELKEKMSEYKKMEETKEKLETHLCQAQRMQAIGTLAGGIAHDFNNILFSILGFAEMAMDDVPENSLARANLEEVLVAAERAGDLVQQILAFSRQIEQERKQLQLHLIVKEALKL